MDDYHESPGFIEAFDKINESQGYVPRRCEDGLAITNHMEDAEIFAGLAWLAALAAAEQKCEQALCEIPAYTATKGQTCQK